MKNQHWSNIKKQIQELKMKYKEHQQAENVLHEQQSEIDFYRKYSESYGYVFYIMKK